MAKSVDRAHEFMMTFEGPDEFTAEMADALYEAGCDDATFGTSHGAHRGTFPRAAATFQEAVDSARADVERAGLA